MSRVTLVLFLMLSALLVACSAEPATTDPLTDPPTDPAATPTSTLTARPTPRPTVTQTATASATQTSSATAGPTPRGTATDGSPSSECVDGWTSASPGSAAYDDGIAILEDHMGVSGTWQLDEMRHFTGPEVPWIIDPEYDEVERWYVKASLADNADLSGRWLLERRTPRIRGVSAVAPYSSTGYQSPDWTGFVGEGTPTTYLGLPGQWSGIPYDFVTGEGDSGNPGLPDEVVGCMNGT